MEQRPDVIVDFVFEDGLIFVSVQNIGSQPALRVQVVFEPAFKGLGGGIFLADLPLFRNIEFLAPSRTIRTLLDSSAAYFARGEPEQITASISYSDRSGHRFSCAIRHDLGIYRDIAFVSKGALQAMAVLRDLPYGNQHFRVDLGDGAEGAVAGFSEVVLPDIDIDVIEYRNGNDKETGVRKIPGLARYDDVILRRGIIGSLNLYNWIDQVRNGDVNARRTVVISLLSEDLGTVVLTWKLLRAFPVKYSFGELDAKGTDVALEELVLAYERMEME